MLIFKDELTRSNASLQPSRVIRFYKTSRELGYYKPTYKPKKVLVIITYKQHKVYTSLLSTIEPYLKKKEVFKKIILKFIHKYYSFYCESAPCISACKFNTKQ